MSEVSVTPEVQGSPAPEPVAPPPPPPPPSVKRDLLGGLMGLAIAAGCWLLFIPVVHEIVVAFGPGIGGFFAGARTRARGWHILVIGVTIGVGEAIITAIAAGILMATGTIGKDTVTILFAVGAMVLAFLWAVVLGSAGAYAASFGGGA